MSDPTPFSKRWIYAAIAAAAFGVFLGPLFKPFAFLGSPLSFPGCLLIDTTHTAIYGNRDIRSSRMSLISFASTLEESEARLYDYRQWLSGSEASMQDLDNGDWEKECDRPDSFNVAVANRRVNEHIGNITRLENDIGEAAICSSTMKSLYYRRDKAGLDAIRSTWQGIRCSDNPRQFLEKEINILKSEMAFRQEMNPKFAQCSADFRRKREELISRHNRRLEIENTLPEVCKSISPWLDGRESIEAL